MKILIKHKLSLGTGIAVLALLFAASHAQEDNGGEDIYNDWDPNWNYDQGGDNWNFTNCNNAKQQQSPVDLKNPGINWWEPEKAVAFTFLPSYTPDVPSIQVVNFTKIASGSFGSILITEPSDYGATQVIKWDAKSVRFHYPSEHTIAGVSYDLEMQIYHEVRYFLT